MNLKAYLSGDKSLSRAIALNVVGLAVFTQLVETLVSKGMVPQFGKPGSLHELAIFVTIIAVVLFFDLIVWRCADNARYRITKIIGKLYATKGLLFFFLIICIWVYKA